MKQLSEEDEKVWTAFTQSGITPSPRNVIVPESSKVRPEVKDISFSTVLDLHNLTLQQAHEASNAHLEQAYYLGIRKVQHITGKSGQISQEFETWARLNPRVRKIQKQNDGGAWLLWLVKK
jgi:DNA-nicking Smr family endonuclease